MELNKAVIDCMRALRKKLREEQQLDIRLSQPDAVNAMLTACLASADEDIRTLGRRLAELSDQVMPSTRPVEADPPSRPAGAPVLIYRGQRVLA